MPKTALLALLSLLLAAGAGVCLAAPAPDGVWQITSDKDGKPQALIRLQTVGGAVQGVLTAFLRGDDPHSLCNKCSGARHGKPIIGMQVLWGLKPNPGEPLTYAGGQILDPGSGSIYGAQMAESPDGRTLTVRGFLGLALLGRTQIWRRVG